jgi:hypothetical protein
MTPIQCQLIQAVEEMWDLHPGWRLGQMIENVALWARQPTEPIDPTWDVEDEELLTTLRGHIERRRKALAEDANGTSAANQPAATTK